MLSTGMLAAYYSITTWLPTFLANKRHLSVGASTGYLLMLISGSLAGYLVSAWLTDTIGRRRGFILFAACAMVLILLYTRLPVAGGMFLIGFPLGFFIPGHLLRHGGLPRRSSPPATCAARGRDLPIASDAASGTLSFFDRPAEHALCARRCHCRIHRRSVCAGHRVGVGDSGDSRPCAHHGKCRRNMRPLGFWIDRAAPSRMSSDARRTSRCRLSSCYRKMPPTTRDAQFEGIRRMLKLAPAELITPHRRPA